MFQYFTFLFWGLIFQSSIYNILLASARRKMAPRFPKQGARQLRSPHLPPPTHSLDVKHHLRWQLGTSWVGDHVAETSERTVLGEHVV